MKIIRRDTGQWYAGGYAVNTGVKWTTCRDHAWWTKSLQDALYFVKVLNRAGHNVKLDRNP